MRRLKADGKTESLQFGVNLGRIALYLELRGDYELSEIYHRKAIENAKNAVSEKSVIYAIRLNALAKMYHKTGRHSLEEQHLQSIRPLLSETGIYPNMRGHLGAVKYNSEIGLRKIIDISAGANASEDRFQRQLEYLFAE